MTAAWVAGCTGLLMAGIAVGLALAVGPVCGAPAAACAACLWGLAFLWRGGRRREAGRHAAARARSRLARPRWTAEELAALRDETSLVAAVSATTAPQEAL